MSRTPNELPLPPTTRRAFEQTGRKCHNAGLLFDRYLRFRSARRWDMGKDKKWNLEQVAGIKFNFNAFKPTIKRWLRTARSQNAEPLRLTPEWRFAVGLGNESAIENGFTFHRIYGFPIIPGSAVKGVARRAALGEVADAFDVFISPLSEIEALGNEKTPLQKLEIWLLQSDEEMARQTEFELNAKRKSLAEAFRRVFGTQHAAGEAIFFDAMPAEAPSLEIDVMNVHYPDYYSGKDVPPADNQNPNPIPFLTVGRTPFWFAVGWRGEVEKDGVEQAAKWQKTGLTEFGIGAKTAVGYGYFEKQQRIGD